MTDLGPMGLDIVNAALEHLTRWMTRLYSTLGDHLVYDSMPIASFSTVVASRERDGGWLDDLWNMIVAGLGLEEQGVYSDWGPCKTNFRYRLKGSENGDVAIYYGRRLHAVACGETGFPIALALTPASFSEQTVLRECLLPQIWRLKDEGLVHPKTFTSDAGQAGLPSTRLVLDANMDPRIAQKDSSAPINLEWQYGELVVLSDGTLAIACDTALRPRTRTDRTSPETWEDTEETELVAEGHGGGRTRRLKRTARVQTINGLEYVEVRLYMPLEVLLERGEDGAIRYACTRVRPDDAALAFVFDPPELRDQLAPGPRADYGLIRNAVEEIWRVLHQYYAMYKSQSWTTSAALDILLGVVARVVAGVANIRRLARLQIRDGIRNWRIIMLERRKV